MKIDVALIVAVARNGVIGKDGGLPWRLSSDLKLFRRLTMGKPIVMGRRTFGSLGKPLDGRDNIVVTTSSSPDFEGAIVARSVDEAMRLARECAQVRGADEIMIIGGAKIYDTMLPIADRVYWTAVDAEPEGDTYLSRLDSGRWKLVSSEELPQTERDEFASRLEIYERAEN